MVPPILPQVLVSVITPFLNSKNYIEKCVTSLFEQDFKEVEFIFINDGSIDNGVEILQKTLAKFPQRKNDVTIVNHQISQGVSISRNTGIQLAKGEYVIHVDSDDYIEKKMLTDLYTFAFQTNADIVWCDFYVDLDKKNIIHRKENVPSLPENCITEILSGKLHAGLWNKLIKREIYTKFNITFPEKIQVSEDMVFVINYLLHVSKVHYLNKPYYHYVQTPESLTITQNRSLFENQIKAILELDLILTKTEFNNDLQKFKGIVKQKMILSNLFKNKEYKQFFLESNHYIYINSSLLKKVLIWLSLNNFHFIYSLFIKTRNIISTR